MSFEHKLLPIVESGHGSYRFLFQLLHPSMILPNSIPSHMGQWVFSSSNPGSGNAQFQIIVDSNPSLRISDTISFEHDTQYLGISTKENLFIVFLPGSDSIESLWCSYDEVEQGSWFGSETQYTFIFSGLQFDSSSIIYPDSTLSHVNFSYRYDNGWNINWEEGQQQHTIATPIPQITLGGIFRPMTLRPASGVSNSNLLPIFSADAYPNPFSQSTEITFTSETSGHADISIVNLLGNEVAHLFSG